MSKRAIMVVIAAVLAATFAAVGAGVVAISAGRGPNAAALQVIWTELVSAPRS
jgi:hypothetical protein